MTTGSLGAHLRSVSESLSSPISARTRILDELRFDLDELTRRLEDEGHSPSDARARATEALLPDGATLEMLDRIHASSYDRLADQLGDRRLKRLEQGLLATALGVAAGGGATALSRVGVLNDPSPYLWVVLGLAVALLGACGRGAVEVWAKGDTASTSRRTRAILILSALTLLSGLIGVTHDVVRVFAHLEAWPDDAASLLPAVLVRESILLGTAIVVAMAGCTFSVIARQWATLIEDRLARALADDTPKTPNASNTNH